MNKELFLNSLKKFAKSAPATKTVEAGDVVGDDGEKVGEFVKETESKTAVGEVCPACGHKMAEAVDDAVEDDADAVDPLGDIMKNLKA